MPSFTTKFALVVVALALLACYASAACSVKRCLNCALANPNQCLVCESGYRLTSRGRCLSRNGALAPQSVAVAAVVALSAMLTYLL
ncbi:hypothetical protein ABL78_7281 [Leptomonas seymouri]|uniref:Surface antigen-like protein n=1 Tax=Leptomonas seymouri TaxID=5684 RepID=A0A0N1II34_LEPSE|nr:hypothetical protein ABL78_7281 [Leptomonas seymouri]|eukprot:KPI83671.1 hypothetical protein ABL78_7281 [Leptomonas seymouri]